MRRLALLLVALSWPACRVDRAPTPALGAGATALAPGATASPVVATKASPNPFCGTSPSDWCPAPAGDPCGAHKDTASCRADSRCVGMRYRGESFVPCQYDARGFAANCPTVGCVSISR